ncbi:MAG: hypothetical protein MR639_00460 [Clostridium sp.]|nr:hypothetical protein [Clostridium sp.]
MEVQLNDDSKYYILFSHHSFENDFAKRGVYNRRAIRDLWNGRSILHIVSSLKTEQCNFQFIIGEGN